MSLYDGQVFMWSDSLLDPGMDFLIGNMVTWTVSPCPCECRGFEVGVLCMYLGMVTILVTGLQRGGGVLLDDL